MSFAVEWTAFVVGIVVTCGGILVFFGRKLQTVDLLAMSMQKLNDADLVTHVVHARICEETTKRYLSIASELREDIRGMDQKREEARKTTEEQLRGIETRITRIETNLEFLVRNIKENL